MTCVAVHEGQNCKCLINRSSWSLILFIYVGLQYQEDLKIRAMNDVTARKDQEHLEVRIRTKRNNSCFSTFFSLGNDQKKRSYALVSTNIF
jgi:hypothetical protein